MPLGTLDVGGGEVSNPTPNFILVVIFFLGAIFFRKPFKTYGEPYRFSGWRDPLVQTERH